jgi:prepilin signal peptidase PulO-like enzyme (type II secretory pathway)
MSHFINILIGAVIGCFIGEVMYRIICENAAARLYRRTKTYVYLVHCGVGIKAAYRLVKTYK